MKKKRYLFYSSLLSSLFILSSCHKDFEFTNNQVPEGYSQEVLGFTTDPNHTWCTTESGVITVIPIQGTKTVQILVYSNDDSESKSLKVLNSTLGDNIVNIHYDTPSTFIDLYAACISESGFITLKKFNLGDLTVDFNESITRSNRVISTSYTLPEVDLVLTGPFDSYGKQRGWNNVTLYAPENEQNLIMEVPDYDKDFSDNMKMIIFSYFKNGKNYDNISLVKSTDFYNENAYPITTGEDPILVSPIYRNDGTSKEIINSELYYYYFNAKDGDPDFYNLKVYRAITLRNSILGNDVLSKHHSYALIYWDENGNGSFYFPPGYKIGFMLRSNVSEGNGKKQGELWADGRLNNEINKYGYFKKAGLGDGDPRMAWLTVNGKIILCCESGVDRDIQDLLLECEGGIEPIDIPPYIEKNSYTFLFEDTFLGDYDLNDVVLKGVRLDETSVEYTLMACGAHDEIYIHNIEGPHINHNREVHGIFNTKQKTFINTEIKSMEYVKDTVQVSKSFSFISKDCQPYIENRTKKYIINISRSGSPYAIMIPYNLGWSRERISITKSYPQFGNWGKNMVESTDWYLYPEINFILN